MNTPTVIPAGAASRATAVPGATPSPSVLGTRSAPAEQQWAQTHALRRLADLLDAIAVPGLSVFVFGVGDHLSVQVPTDLGDPETRTTVVAMLATTIGTEGAYRPDPITDCGSFAADGMLAGHPIHIHTPITKGNSQ